MKALAGAVMLPESRVAAPRRDRFGNVVKDKIIDPFRVYAVSKPILNSKKSNLNGSIL